MNEIIEKEFKKNNPYKKYRIYYWIYFFVIFMVMITLHFIFKINSWILCIILYFVFICQYIFTLNIKLKDILEKKS